MSLSQNTLDGFIRVGTLLAYMQGRQSPLEPAETMVDIPRPSSFVKQRRIRRILYGAAALVVLVVAGIFIARLKPAAPPVDRGTVWIDEVRRGRMVRQVRGLGTLVPVDIRWIPATTNGRVEKILIQPGSPVEPNTDILELSNPEVQQAAEGAASQLAAAEAQATNLRVQLRNQWLAQQSATAAVKAEFQQAQLQAESDAELAKEGLISPLTSRLSKVRSESLTMRYDIEQKRLDSLQQSNDAQVEVQQAEVDRLGTLYKLRRDQVASLRVKAGFDGVLTQVPVEVGQQVAPGTNLARVANNVRLKAELRIAETQAKDIQIGQPASIDTRNGIIPGRVARIDPTVQNATVKVDVSLEGALPAGARPDLSVDGTVELERLDNVLYVGRPAFGQEQSTIALFRLDQDGQTADRVTVKVGKSSVNTIEVLGGLKEGDRVILSDMSAYDAVDRIRLR